MGIKKTTEIFSRYGYLLQRERIAWPCNWYYNQEYDCIIWPDETSAVPQELLVELKRVYKYRTALLCGVLTKKDKKIWKAARKNFPKWKGFKKQRCRLNFEIKKKLSRIRKYVPIGVFSV
jgi:hypothetical protein